MKKYLQGFVGLGLLLALGACTSNTVIPQSTCVGNCVNGSGTLRYADGSTLNAQFKLGVPTGAVQLQRPNGDRSQGTLLNGVYHGVSSIQTADGKQFEQRYAYGLPADGESRRANGDVYTGSFRHSLVDGQVVSSFKQGTYKTVLGHSYQGAFRVLGDQLIFDGQLKKGGDKAQALLAHAPYAAFPAGFEFKAISPEKLAALEAGIKQRLAQAQAQAQQAAVLAAAAPVQNLAAAPVRAKVAVTPIEGNTGLFMSPITSDGVAAEWVNKSINAKLGASLGGAVGAYAGQKALEQVPFVGGFLGQKAGKAMGRSVALQAVGGEAYLRKTSDISFNNMQDMARWLVDNHATHSKFKEIMDAACQIYPELRPAFIAASSAR